MSESAPITQFRVTGMDCPSCAQSVQRGVSQLAGVEACTLTFATGALRVEGSASPASVVAQVRALGYEIAPDSHESTANPTEAAQTGLWRFLVGRRTTLLALIGLILVLPGLIVDELLPFLGLGGPWVAATSLAALLVAGYPIARNALRSLFVARQVTMHTLMTIAAIGAVVIGAYTEAAMVVVLFALGEALEGYTMDRARDSLRQMMSLVPRTATVLRPCMDCKEHLGQEGYTGGACPFCGIEEQEVAVDTLAIGEQIVVKPGERIPIDGTIRQGSSAINQAPITGESMPVDKTLGGTVFAGSINGEGALVVEVTHLAADTTMSRMIRMVEEAQERRAPAQRFVERFAEVYTPVVVVMAALVATVPPLIFGAPFFNPDVATQGWLYRALELLVVACPCALIISTPVSLVSAISNAARNGVLIKGGAYLEALSSVRAFAFDKTGTLTEGQPSIVSLRSSLCVQNGEQVAHTCQDCEDMLAVASAVERRSNHPLARAVVAAAERQGVLATYGAAEDVITEVGVGVSGRVREREVFIGSHAHFDGRVPHGDATCRELNALADQGYTPMLVSVDRAFAGYMAVADGVRESSRQAIVALRDQGVKTLVMLTGDNAATARRIAAEVGVTDVRADLLPGQKAQAVEELLREHSAVAMVGDGINDAPALATASVGIAMGAGGSAQALETADIALMDDDLRKLPFAYQLSRATMRTIKQNVTFALLSKLLVVVLVLLGLGNLWLAVLADVGASLVVTLYGMRLLRWKV